MKKIEHIAIIEDNEVTNYYTQDLLESIGAFEKISFFTTSNDAIAYFEQTPPQSADFPKVVLLDLRIDERDGFEILDELYHILSENTHANLYILTSSDHKRDLEKAATFSFIKGYLNKPITREKIEEILKDI